MAKPKPPPTATDDEMRALLRRFHAAPTRFLGNIATPAMQPTLMETVSALRGRYLPAFDMLDVANELIGVLVMGRWNRRGRHHERSAPFRPEAHRCVGHTRGWRSLRRCETEGA